MLDSNYQDLGPVRLPVWQGRQRYMVSFDPLNMERPLADVGFSDYRPVVEQLLVAAEVETEVVHMTVDEGIVEAGQSQRRPGPHVDGRFLPEEGKFSQGRWGHEGDEPRWAHYCNRIPMDRMSVIVAANPAGCMVWEGLFDGSPKEDGDLSHLRGQLGSGVLLSAQRGYLLSPDCVHESVQFANTTQRTFLRLAFDHRETV